MEAIMQICHVWAPEGRKTNGLKNLWSVMNELGAPLLTKDPGSPKAKKNDPKKNDPKDTKELDYNTIMYSFFLTYSYTFYTNKITISESDRPLSKPTL